MDRINPAIIAHQNRYMKIFAGFIVSFIIVYTLYLMGYLNYFHAWLMRGILAVYVVALVYLVFTYYRSRAEIARAGAPGRR